MTNRAIILAAGESYDTSDIFPKVLLKNPISKKTILETFADHYPSKSIFVLGFRSLSVLNTHPNINVVLNHSWATTKSAHSLALAISTLEDEEIVDVYSGDYFIEEEFFKEFQSNESENILVATFRESRSHKACNLEVKNNKIGYVFKENHLKFAQIGLVALFSIRCKQTTMIGSFIQQSNGFISFK